MNKGTDKKVITKQVIIDTKYSSRLLPITADEKVIDIIQAALTELAEIKQRAEEILSNLTESPRSTSKTMRTVIDYILKGEKK